MEISSLRKNYQKGSLSSHSMKEDPFEQFIEWMQDALREKIIEPNAFTLGTASKDGNPTTRTVLLKELNPEGFAFYTNYESRKAKDLAENPKASLTTYWKKLERQITIEGVVEKLSIDASLKYFETRSRESQLSAWCSKQGTPIPSRAYLLEQFAYYQEKFKDTKIPLPEFWGGYKLTPKCYIFWQGREHRLHDRFSYFLNKQGQWEINRLAP